MYKYVCINTNPLKSQVCLSPTQILFFFANSNHWPPSRSSRLGRKHVSPGGQGSKGPEMHGVDIGVFSTLSCLFYIKKCWGWLISIYSTGINLETEVNQLRLIVIHCYSLRSPWFGWSDVVQGNHLRFNRIQVVDPRHGNGMLAKEASIALPKSTTTKDPLEERSLISLIQIHIYNYISPTSTEILL